MTPRIVKPRGLVGGLLVTAIGAGFLVFGRELEFGTSRSMGPGYFPTALSLPMIALGTLLAGLGWRARLEEGAFARVPWRSLLLVVGAVGVFGLTLRGIGLAAAVAATANPPELPPSPA